MPKHPGNINLPKARREEQEFVAEKGIILCETCGVAYFKKRWHHGLEELKFSEKSPSSAKASAGKDLPVRHGVCPACKMIANKQYEGRITIKNFPGDWTQRLEELVDGFGKRAWDRDPMDRIIEIKSSPSTSSGYKNLVVTTTENQLANKLAQKIKSTFHKLKSRTHFAPEPSDVAEVVIEF